MKIFSFLSEKNFFGFGGRYAPEKVKFKPPKRSFWLKGNAGGKITLQKTLAEPKITNHSPLSDSFTFIFLVIHVTPNFVCFPSLGAGGDYLHREILYASGIVHGDAAVTLSAIITEPLAAFFKTKACHFLHKVALLII